MYPIRHLHTFLKFRIEECHQNLLNSPLPLILIHNTVQFMYGYKLTFPSASQTIAENLLKFYITDLHQLSGQFLFSTTSKHKMLQLP
jgi:hypothetical protein